MKKTFFTKFIENLIFSICLILVYSLCSPALAQAETKAQGCGLESCHGLNLKCGFNPPDVCTAMYAIGDFCRQYAECQVTENKCELKKNHKLELCLSCMKACPTGDPLKHANCETKCRNKIERIK